MIRTPEQDLELELKDPEYVKFYGASDAKLEIAIAISNARREAGNTQKELADTMGLSQPYIARLEGGEANPTIGTIGSLLASLGCRLVVKIGPLLPDVKESSVQSEIISEMSSKEHPVLLHEQRSTFGNCCGTRDQD
jgi:transcriptional regulator with XRE-family HTH domain